ncbi:MAG: GNAT family N-acetyltransferase [Rubrivivax sp.]
MDAPHGLAGSEGVDPALLARIEDASLNASAPPQQRWLDGWLVRFSPGKARRARSIQAVAPGRLPVDAKLALAAEVYREAALPMQVRVTPFSAPEGLDAHLAALGWEAIEDTRVMVCADRHAGPARAQPAGLCWTELDATAFAEAVGALRGSTPAARVAHAERLRAAPVVFRAYAWTDAASGAVLACGQFAREGALVGLYDVFTAPACRRNGLASSLCERMLSTSASEGAGIAYLQVDAANSAAQSVYRRLGFAEGYSYHYRVPPASS